MRLSSYIRRIWHITSIVACVLSPSALWAVDLLPDIIVRESDLYDHDIVTNIQPGRVHLRLSNGTPNVGDGKLYLYGILPPIDDSTQQVMQRIYNTDGGYTDRLAGNFIFHSTHSHIHFEGWSQYRLRELLPGDSVGDIVAEGEKTSFCVADFAIYDNSLPNFDPDGQFFNCSGTVQGLSVGWLDVYSKTLPDQWIDITGVPDGVYWLESEADPDDKILEKDETNNITRVQVVVGVPDPINPDSYEPNDSLAQVARRPVGGSNSPNLGPCNPQRVIPSLTLHADGNIDLFRFYMNDFGDNGDFIKVTFVHNQGDVDLRLLDEFGTVLASSQGVTNSETISLNGYGEGWYFARVYGYNGALSPEYELTIDPPANSPPAIQVIDPPVGDTTIIHGVETYTTTWTHSDAENDDMWVTVYLNTSPVLDGNETVLPSTLHTDASAGFAIINTAYVDTGTYYVYCEITDGGTTTGDWSDGTITMAEPTDSDGDGVSDDVDNCPYYANPAQDTCGTAGELSGDGVVGPVDVNLLIDYIFFNGPDLMADPGCPRVNRGDFNCDGVVDNLDLNRMIDHIYFNGPDACDPCACINYPEVCP
ncbi:MAG: hypothetical protein Kow0074_11550 [Candidatus Zixiibacteriota bacterium]